MVEWDRQKADPGRCLYMAGRRCSNHLGAASNAGRTATVLKTRVKRDPGEDGMKKNYDFSKAKRGAVLPSPPGKTRITIRIDAEVLEWFREQVNAAGGGNYQTMMNRALRDHMDGKVGSFEETLRKVLGKCYRRPNPTGGCRAVGDDDVGTVKTADRPTPEAARAAAQRRSNLRFKIVTISSAFRREGSALGTNAEPWNVPA